MKMNYSQLLIGAILGLVATLQAQFFYLPNNKHCSISAYTMASDRILTSVGLFATGSAPLCVTVDTVANLLSLILSNFDRKTILACSPDSHLGIIQDDRKQARAIYARLQSTGDALRPPQGNVRKLGLLAPGSGRHSG